MKLSIIIPAYNRENLIGQALRSLLRQRDVAELDIVVIDDGSTDRTAEVVSQHMQQTPGIRLARQPNLGVAKARNAALRLVPEDTDLVSFLDSDDVSPAGRFAADLELFRAEPSLELVYALTCKVDRIDDYRLEPADGAVCEVNRAIQLGAGVYRRQLLRKIGYFDEDFRQAEDTDYLFRIFESNAHRVLTDRIGVYYRQHEHSLMGRKDEVKREFLKAVLKSSRRRRLNPALGGIGEIFVPPLSGASDGGPPRSG